MVDVAGVVLSGVLAVYNVECLTGGHCNLWAAVVGFGFFIRVIMGMFEGTTRAYRGREVRVPGEVAPGREAKEQAESSATRVWRHVASERELLSLLYPLYPTCRSGDS